MKNPLKIAIFADGADKETMLKRYREGLVGGFTTNPTLMAKAGIKDYENFAKSVLEVITDMPISFEVFSDEFSEMEQQANKIAAWGRNVNVKIPITNTRGESALPLVRRLLDKGVKINLTALMTQEQLSETLKILKKSDDIIISIFAGRIADTGRDPMPMMKQAVSDFAPFPNAKILWASPREALNFYQAEACGCHIITATDDLIAKLVNKGKSLSEFSLDTVKMFYNDAKKAGFTL